MWTGTLCKGEGVKRWLAKLVVFVLLGAIVNVAVAWGCVLLSTPVRPAIDPGRFNTDFSRLVYEHRSFGSARFWETRVGPGSGTPIVRPTVDVLPNWARDDSLRPLTLRVYEGRGWPELALWCVHDRPQVANRQFNSRGALDAGLPDAPSQGWMSAPRALPLRPIWPGFTINTIFYAAILWLLALGPFTVRRMIRRRRGHCIKCGYDLRGAEHEVCPECGVEV